MNAVRLAIFVAFVLGCAVVAALLPHLIPDSEEANR